MIRLLILTLFALTRPLSGWTAPTTLRVGYFPNITHTQALIASELTRQGKGWFEPRLGPEVKIVWFSYNAGPSAMEALASHSIEFTYVGPNPALNLYSRSQGEEVRVIAGAAFGGSALVVQSDGRLSKPADFRDKLIATPQLGNTQDIACRGWLKKHGFRITQIGGDVRVIPTANPDQLSLFIAGKLDGVWTVEPWVSRLALDAHGTVFLTDKVGATTLLVSSQKILSQSPDLVKKFAAAHAELTTWINQNPQEAKDLANHARKNPRSRLVKPHFLLHHHPHRTRPNARRCPKRRLPQTHPQPRSPLRIPRTHPLQKLNPIPNPLPLSLFNERPTQRTPSRSPSKTLRRFRLQNFPRWRGRDSSPR
ncbi:MAG: ABC transporter substrate-binding protein [Verrucomicrobia bacterium]|nr:ABC transporter substrate-binding protein [Verrucomicrobiota bacterium]